LKHDLSWSDKQYGDIVFYFQLAYAIGLLLSGPVIDRIGTKLGYAASLLIWSFAAMAHAGVRTVTGFSATRFALGLGEAGNFPAAIKTVAEWFPKRERALATGIFNAGTNVGAILAPLAVPWITLRWGWSGPFSLQARPACSGWRCGCRSTTIRENIRAFSGEELAWIEPIRREPMMRLKWRDVIKYPQAWAFALGKFITDPIWWFYLYWTGLFLDSKFGIKLSQLSLPLVVIYLVADIGSVGGGWIFIAADQSMAGRSICSRKNCDADLCDLRAAGFLCAADEELVTAWQLLSIALPRIRVGRPPVHRRIGLFPKRAVGSVVGLGGMLGSVGGMIAARPSARPWSEPKTPAIFMSRHRLSAGAVIVNCSAPRMEPARVDS